MPCALYFRQRSSVQDDPLVYPNTGVIIVHAGVPYYWWAGVLSAREIQDEVAHSLSGAMDMAVGFLHSGCRDYAKLFDCCTCMGVGTSREYDEVFQPIA